MIMNPIEIAHKLIAESQFDQLDDLWTEMIIDGTQKLENLLSITRELKKIKKTDHALLLLEMLTGQYEQDKKYFSMIEVYKAMLYYHANEKKIREKLIELYHRAYPNDINLDEYIELSGIYTDEPLLKAIGKLEEFLKFSVGQQFFFDKYGLGSVIEAMPRQREIVIDFEKAKRYFLKIDVAKGLLKPVSPDHFLALKNSNPSKLKSILEKDPVDLVKKLIKDWDGPLTASQIKNLLDGIITKVEIENFWDRVKKNLDKNPQIKTEGKSTKTYRYIADYRAENQAVLQKFEKALPGEKYKIAQEINRHNPELLTNILPALKTLGNNLHEKDPALATHIFIFVQQHDDPGGLEYSPESILEKIEPVQLLNDMSEADHQRIIIDIVKEKSGGQWVETLKKIFLMLKDTALIDYIDAKLANTEASMSALYQQILTLPKNYPEQYKWLLKKMVSGSYREHLLPALVPRIIQSSDFIKGAKLTVQKLLDLETFDQIIRTATVDDALRIYNALMTSPIDGHHKKGLMRIIEYYHASLFKKHEEIIYTTESSLTKRQAELKHLLEVEIPANKKEIGRAREHGDLSENFEYKAAKEKQDQLYAKVRLIEEELKKVRLIESNSIDTSKVSIGTKVILEDIKTSNKTYYTILGRWDTDLERNVIANEAPIAVHLLNKKINDQIEINAINYKILNIEKAF